MEMKLTNSLLRTYCWCKSREEFSPSNITKFTNRGTAPISAARALFHGSGYAQIFAKDSKNEQWYAPFSRLRSSEGSVKEEKVRAVSSRNCCTNWPLASLVTSAIYQHRLSRLKSFILPFIIIIEYWKRKNNLKFLIT